MCGFLFLLNNFPLQSLGRVELSNRVLQQTLGKLKSLQGTELSVVVLVCLLGSF